jgi:hypothetical protein
MGALHPRSLWVVGIDYVILAERVSRRLGKNYSAKYCRNVHNGNACSRAVDIAIKNIIKSEPIPVHEGRHD